jgi:hypothetical protein
LAQKAGALARFRDFFCGILEGLKWFRTYSKIFFETEGPCYNISKCTRIAAQFTTSSGASVQDLQNLMNFGIFFNMKTHGPGPRSL